MFYLLIIFLHNKFYLPSKLSYTFFNLIIKEGCGEGGFGRVVVLGF